MLRTKLRNQFLKNKTLESGIKYKKQRNVCVSLAIQVSRKWFEHLNMIINNFGTPQKHSYIKYYFIEMLSKWW